jgi:hypothetical protein
MWTELVRQVQHYPTAVITMIDQAGYPLSIRCHPQIDRDAQVLRIALAPGIGAMRPGPASLLCHAHNEKLWRLRNLLVRGTIELAPNTDDTWLFFPRRLIRGQSRSPLYFVRTLVASRRAARRYLALRGISRPLIPWQHIHKARASGASKSESKSEWNVTAKGGERHDNISID